MSGPWKRATFCPLCPTTEVMRPTVVGKTAALRCRVGHLLVAVASGGSGTVAGTTRTMGSADRMRGEAGV